MQKVAIHTRAAQSYERWADAWVHRHLEITKQDIKRRDPRKLAVARHMRLLAREAAKLPGFRDPVPNIETLTEWYEQRDAPETVRSLIDPIFRDAFVKAFALREEARSRLTLVQTATLDMVRSEVYPATPGYSVDFWRDVLCALQWCSQPVLAPRLAFWDWIHG